MRFSLVNEHGLQPVFFDDFEVKQLPTDQALTVTSWTDYYPYGKVAKSSCPSNGAYRYGYQGEFAEKDQDTDWNSFELRQYDSDIARWLSPDPYGQYWSPYMAMGNDPSNRIDPDGGFDHGQGSPVVVESPQPFQIDMSFGAMQMDNWMRQVQSSFTLEPLTKERLRQLGGAAGIPSSSMPFELELGRAFEEHALQMLHLNKYIGKAIVTRERYAKTGMATIPDAMRSVAVFSQGHVTVHHNSSLFEMKAYQETNIISLSTDDYQPLGMLEIAQQSAAGGRSVVTFVTTANVSFHADFLAEAVRRNVSIYQIVAFELILNGQKTGQIGFFDAQPVLNPNPFSRVQLQTIKNWTPQMPLRRR